MIFYNSMVNYWQAAEHDLLVVPVDCGGRVHEHSPLSVMNARVTGLKVEYELLSNANRLTTGTTKFFWRGGNKIVKFVVYLPLSPNGNTFHTFKAWTDCMEDLASKLYVITNVRTVGLPHLPSIGDWDKQEDKLIDLFGGFSGEVMLYTWTDAQVGDEVEQESGLVLA